MNPVPFLREHGRASLLEAGLSEAAVSLPGIRLKDVSCEKFVAAINKAVPSLVRTESDELTYCLHIISAQELEKQLMDGSLAITDLPPPG